MADRYVVGFVDGNKIASALVDSETDEYVLFGRGAKIAHTGARYLNDGINMREDYNGLWRLPSGELVDSF